METGTGLDYLLYKDSTLKYYPGYCKRVER